MNPRPQDTKILHQIRRAELELVRSFIFPGARVLEFGAALGHQARILTDWGAKVSAIDIIEQIPPYSVFPVLKYDGWNFPFPDASFDIAISSNAITQIRPGAHLDHILKEFSRVLVPGGLAIHVIATPSWRFWTSLLHPVFMFERGVGRLTRKLRNNSPPSKSDSRQREHISRPPILALLFARPVTAADSVIEEFFLLRKLRWKRVLKEGGFNVEKVIDTALFYTGHVRFNGISVPTRRAISRLLGSASRVYVTRAMPLEFNRHVANM